MNAKVLSVLMVLVLVNTCIGLPSDGLVNSDKTIHGLFQFNNTVNNCYYECRFVCGLGGTQNCRYLCW